MADGEGLLVALFGLFITAQARLKQAQVVGAAGFTPFIANQAVKLQRLLVILASLFIFSNLAVNEAEIIEAGRFELLILKGAFTV